MLPLALGMAGRLAKEQPLDPALWRTVHEKLQGKRTKFHDMKNGMLFSAFDTSIYDLPLPQQEQLQLMAVMASGVDATSQMLANLWDQVCGIHPDIFSLPILFIISCDSAWMRFPPACRERSRDLMLYRALFLATTLLF